MKCCLRATREKFLSVTHFPLCLIYQHCPDILVISCWNPYFYFVVINYFYDSWLKIDGLPYFAK